MDNTNDLDPKMRKKFEMSNVKNVIARPQSLMLRPKSLYISRAVIYFSKTEFEIWEPFTNYVSMILQFFDQPTNLVSIFTN